MVERESGINLLSSRRTICDSGNESLLRKRFIESLALLAVAAPAFGARTVTFQDHVLPLMRNRCIRCHNPDKAKGALDVSNYSAMMQGGGSGEVIVPGDPDSSRLFRLIAHLEEPRMPKNSVKIPDDELAIVREWIQGGLLETDKSKPVVGNNSKIDLSVSAASQGRPRGPLPMPEDVLLETVVATERPKAITAIAHSPWAPVIAIAGQKQVVLYHTESRRDDLVGVLPFLDGAIHTLRFSRNGGLLLAGGGRDGVSGKVVIWDIRDGRRVIEVGEELDAVLAADISSDQTRIALGGPGKIVNVYATSDGAQLHTITKHTDWITAAEYSPDSVLLATADRNGGVFVWEAHSGLEFYTLAGHASGVTMLSWRIDSNYLATAGSDGNIRLWEMNSGKQVKSWTAHPGGVLAINFTHDGRLVSCGRDKLVKVWNQEGQQQQVLEPFDDLALQAVFNHDGQRIVAGDWAGEVRVSSSNDGKFIGNLTPNPPPLAERISVQTLRVQKLAARHGELETKLRVAYEAAALAVAKLHKMQMTAKKSEQAMTKAQGQLDAAKEQSNQITRAFEIAQHNLTMLPPELTRLSDTRAQITAALQRASAEQLALEEAVPASQAVYESLTQTAAKADAAEKKSPSDDELSQAVANAKSAVESAARALDAIQRANATKKEEVEALKATLSATESASTTVATVVARSESTVTDFPEQKRTAESQLGAANEQLTAANSEMAAATAVLEAAEQKAKVATDSEASAMAAVDSVVPGLADSRYTLARYQAGLVNIKLHAARAELADRKQRYDQRNAAASALYAKVDEANRQLATFEEAASKMPSAIGAAKEEVGKAKANLLQKEDVLKQVQQVFEEKTSLLSEANELAKQVSNGAEEEVGNEALLQASQAANKTGELLKQDLAYAEIMVKAANAEIEQVTADVETAQTVLTARKSEFDAMPNQISRHKAEIEKHVATATAESTHVKEAADSVQRAQQIVDELTQEYQSLKPTSPE